MARNPTDRRTTAMVDAVSNWVSTGQAVQARAAADLSQGALAKILGVSQQAVGSWETGRVLPSGQRLRKYHSWLTRNLTAPASTK